MKLVWPSKLFCVGSLCGRLQDAVGTQVTHKHTHQRQRQMSFCVFFLSAVVTVANIYDRAYSRPKESVPNQPKWPACAEVSHFLYAAHLE